MSDIEALQTAIRNHWSSTPGAKTQRYIGRFFSRARTGTKIVARVTGNHGGYTVSIAVGAHGVTAACSCYVGKGGSCCTRKLRHLGDGYPDERGAVAHVKPTG